MSKFLKSLSQKRILVPHIERYLQKAEFPDEWKLTINPNKTPDQFTPTFHPSGDCLGCARILYAKYNGDLPKDEKDATSQKNFAVGNFWHIWLQTILVDELGFATWEDVEKKCVKVSWEGRGWVQVGENGKYPDPTWMTSGSADVICNIPGYDEPYLVDFKTMNSRQFAQTNDKLEHIIRKWRYQVMCYMEWLGLEQAIVVVIEKDTPHAFREIVIKYDPELLPPVYDKWTEVAFALKYGTVPEYDTCESSGHTAGTCPANQIYLPGH